MKVLFKLGAACLVMAMASGCSKEATGQTVAVVNGEEVSLSELNAEIALSNVPQNADKAKVTSELLQRIVDRKLLAQQAVDQGIAKSPDYIMRQRRNNEELLVGLLGQRQSDSIKLPTQAEIDQFIAANPNMFAQREILLLKQLQFATPADPTMLTRLKDEHSLDGVAAALTQMKIQFERGEGRLDTATLNPDTLKQINNLPPGEPFILRSNDRVVVSTVASRQPQQANEEERRKAAAEVIRRRNLNALLQRRLDEARTSAKISYQPGYEAPAAAAAEKK